MRIIKKWLLILAIVFFGQNITLPLAWKFSLGTELGIFFILIGIIIQLIIIFIVIKDSIFAKILYTINGFALSIVMIFLLGFLSNTIHHKQIIQYNKNQQVSHYCTSVKLMFERQTGLDKMDWHDPKYGQLDKQSLQEYENCLKNQGYVEQKEICPFIICLK